MNDTARLLPIVLSSSTRPQLTNERLTKRSKPQSGIFREDPYSTHRTGLTARDPPGRMVARPMLYAQHIPRPIYPDYESELQPSLFTPHNGGKLDSPLI